MFDDHDGEVIGFNSCWKTVSVTAADSSQTTEFSTQENATNTMASNSVQTQTDKAAKPEISTLSDPTKLATWLKKIAPMVFAELKINENSTLFDEYDPYADGVDSSDTKARHLQTLNAKGLHRSHSLSEDTSSSSTTEKVPVCGISWSCTGSSLAVIYGHQYHEDWCQHDSVFDLFTRNARNDNLKISKAFNISSCGTSIAYHGTEPALLATSTISGETVVWNLQHTEEENCVIGQNSFAHSGKAICSLLWIDNTHSSYPAGNQILVSCGNGGIINMWLINVTSSSFNLYMSFLLYGSSMNKSKLSPDISCMDFSFLWGNQSANKVINDDIFVVGCRTGNVIVCDKSNARPIPGSNSLDPFKQEKLGHSGSVLSLQFCKKSNCEIFMTLGADQEIRIYSTIDADTPLSITCAEVCLSFAQWVPESKNMLLAATVPGSSGKGDDLKVYNVATMQEITVDGLKDENCKNTCAITYLAFNCKNLNKVACGTKEGTVKLWRIPFKTLQ